MHAPKLAQIFWPWHPAKGSQIGVSIAVTDLPLISSWTLHKSCTIHKSLWAQLPWRNAHPLYHWVSIYKHLQTASSVANVYLRTLKALKLLGDYPINGLDKTNHSRRKHFLVWTCCCEAGPTASLWFNSLCLSSLGLLKDFAESYSCSASSPCSGGKAANIFHCGTRSHSPSNQSCRTASMATNPCVSWRWLRQGHYVIMDNLHQSATHLGTSNHIWWIMHLMMHCRSYSLTAGRPGGISIKLLFVHLRSATAAHSTSL